ncbi:MAG TPA: MFS transporter [Candidatus Binataceae bacterium]|nr:MFS transporter [Candidatus Binataceae bacterium]
MADAPERTAIRKIYLRLLPVALLIYFLCYIDRINVSFAALTMNKDLGLDASIFGIAAGAFFWGYCLFEVPSNIVLEKVGARLWLARIMVTWGLLSGATAFCVGPWSFMIVRFLLGVAEAGLYPGVLLFFTYWFPDKHRARIFAGFTLALPAAVAAGAPMSTGLMELDGIWGLAGWKWMFLVESVPTVIIGCLLPFILTNRPSEARWLNAEERDWLIRTLDRERRQIEAQRKVGLLESFWNPRVLLLALNFFGIVTASLGLLLFLPQIVKQIGLTNMQVGWAGMVPYICGSLSMLVWGWLSDRMDERRWNLFTACVVAAVGLMIAGVFVGSYWSLVGMSIAAIGLYGTKGPFWAIPSMFLTGTSAAASFAWINSIGNLGGFFGPSIVGWVKTNTGSFSGGLYALAAFALMAAIVAAGWLQIPKPASLVAPPAAPAE